MKVRLKRRGNGEYSFWARHPRPMTLYVIPCTGGYHVQYWTGAQAHWHRVKTLSEARTKISEIIKAGE